MRTELRKEQSLSVSTKNNRMKKLIFLFLAASTFHASVAQDANPPFYKDIQAFKKKDSVSAPPKNAILFIGSSSFTMWRSVQDSFPGYTIINRGFGGSTLLDQIRYVNDIVFPYEPKQIIIYCGENDLAANDSVTGKMVFERFKRLFIIIRSKLRKTEIVYVSMKPSPSRVLLLPKMREGNELIRKFLKQKSRTGYIDVYSAMIDGEGRPIPELFLADNLHMNSKGYEIWKRLIQPHLKK